VQIRTEEMDLIAERGIAAHWTYKHGGASNSARPGRIPGLPTCWKASAQRALRWNSSKTSRSTCFPTRSTCSQPKGDILSLPRNATALDFAYAVHTDVGNHAVAARVDKKLVPLRTKLVSGQKVEVISAKSAAPKPQWLEFVVTGKARTAIRHQLKSLQHEDAVQLGHRMLDRSLEDLGTSLDRLPTGAWTRTWPRIASHAWRRCWRKSRSATACPPRSRARWHGRRPRAARCAPLSSPHARRATGS
jgi:guanosine-3',5'-bis(diphosphate) 3'-pyrophosphohydrolase